MIFEGKQLVSLYSDPNRASLSLWLEFYFPWYVRVWSGIVGGGKAIGTAFDARSAVIAENDGSRCRTKGVTELRLTDSFGYSFIQITQHWNIKQTWSFSITLSRVQVRSLKRPSFVKFLMVCANPTRSEDNVFSFRLCIVAKLYSWKKKKFYKVHLFIVRQRSARPIFGDPRVDELDELSRTPTSRIGLMRWSLVQKQMGTEEREFSNKSET